MSSQPVRGGQSGALGTRTNNMANYENLRKEAYQTGMMLQEKEQHYYKERQRMLDEMDAKFRTNVAPLEDRLYQAKDQIESAQQMALRKLRRMEDQVIADSTIPSQEKIKRIEALRNSFTKTFHPDDEYERYTKECSMEKLIQALFGPNMMGMLGMGMGTPMMLSGPETKVISYSMSAGRSPPSSQTFALPQSGPMIEEVIE